MIDALKGVAKRTLWAALRVVPEPVVRRILPASQRWAPASVPAPLAPPVTPVRLFIGASNMAGQARNWARAAERHLPGVGATSLSAGGDGGFAFPVDQRVPEKVYRWARSWRIAQERRVSEEYTHVLVEFARPLFGDSFGRRWTVDVRRLRRAGVVVGAVFHGSDVRLPSRHAARSPWSPFHEPLEGMTAMFEARVARVHAELAGLDLPVFVSTPDLLVDLPAATWLPVVVEPGLWRLPGTPRALTRPRPVVVHAPSKSALKGSALVDPVLESLAAEGLIEYRRVRGVPAAEMPGAVADADIVVDQLRMGIYGVAACEAMAAGRLVVSQVSGHVRDRVRAETGHDLPIVDVTPDTLERTIRDIVADPDRDRATAEAGPAFVDAVHDGRRSAAVLSGFLGIGRALS